MSLLLIKLHKIAQQDHHFYSRKKYVKLNDEGDNFTVYRAPDNWLIRAVKGFFGRTECSSSENAKIIKAFESIKREYIDKNTVYENTLDPKVLQSILSKVNNGRISLGVLQKSLGFQKNKNSSFLKNGTGIPTLKIKNHYNNFRNHWRKKESKIASATHKELQSFRDDLEKDENLKKLKNESDKILLEMNQLEEHGGYEGIQARLNLEEELTNFNEKTKVMEARINENIESQENLINCRVNDFEKKIKEKLKKIKNIPKLEGENADAFKKSINEAILLRRELLLDSDILKDLNLEQAEQVKSINEAIQEIINMTNEMNEKVGNDNKVELVKPLIFQ